VNFDRVPHHQYLFFDMQRRQLASLPGKGITPDISHNGIITTGRKLYSSKTYPLWGFEVAKSLL